MLVVINTILIIVLLLVVIQDFKYRAIHVVLPLLLLVAGLAKFFAQKNSGLELVTTFLFLALVMLGLVLYLSVKHRKVINPLKQDIGLGDIVFFIVIIPLFYVQSYVVFFITGMVLTILLHLLTGGKKEDHLPLAGYLSGYLLLLMMVDFCVTKELFYTHVLF